MMEKPKAGDMFLSDIGEELRIEEVITDEESLAEVEMEDDELLVKADDGERYVLYDCAGEWTGSQVE